MRPPARQATSRMLVLLRTAPPRAAPAAMPAFEDALIHAPASSGDVASVRTAAVWVIEGTAPKAPFQTAPAAITRASPGKAAPADAIPAARMARATRVLVRKWWS